MKVYEVTITETIVRTTTDYIVAEDWDDAEEIARNKYWDCDYDDELQEDSRQYVDAVAEETDEDPEDYE